MSTRCNLRRRVVLALHVIRRESGERQLVHTLDITETSARLGGLNFSLEPGEVVEIRRGVVKARFEVVWMGAPNSALDGQAGVRSLEPNKSIWGVDLPKDQSDARVDLSLRNSKPAVRTMSHRPAGKRRHERYPCSGTASIKTEGNAFPLHGQVQDISEGGIYVEMTAPMAVDTKVTIGLRIEGVWVEFEGTVRTSYPLVGMGVAFREFTEANREKLNALLSGLKQRASIENSNFVVEFGPSVFSEKGSTQPRRQEVYSLRVLALACRTLANNLENVSDSQSSSDIEELRLAISLLHQKLSPSPVELVEFLTALPSGTA
jgi:hypothetical protein